MHAPRRIQKSKTCTVPHNSKQLQAYKLILHRSVSLNGLHVAYQWRSCMGKAEAALPLHAANILQGRAKMHDMQQNGEEDTYLSPIREWVLDANPKRNVH